MFPWVHTSLPCRRHLDQFTRLCRAHPCVKIPICHLSCSDCIHLTLIPIQYVLPCVHMSQPLIQNLDRFSHFCIHHCKSSQCFSMGWKTPKIAPSLDRIGPPSFTMHYTVLCYTTVDCKKVI